MQMRIFLAGAAGAIGRRMVPLLLKAGHQVTGTTRSAEKAEVLHRLGVTPIIVDVFDSTALRDVVMRARPEIVIHQLTDLALFSDPAAIEEARARNARLRIEGTANLVVATLAAGARRMIAQSISFAYAPGPEPHRETDPLNFGVDGKPSVSVCGIVALEGEVTQAPGFEGVVLRYGRLYGPGTGVEMRPGRGSIHVDAAAHAALLVIDRGASGIYNIAEDDGEVAVEKARVELGFNPEFRISG